MHVDMSLLLGVLVGLILGTFYAGQLTTYLPLLIVMSIVLFLGFFLKSK